MESEVRRKQIIDVLAHASGPVTGAELSKRCQVSRQIIVGDVALLRARGVSIISTPRGYQLEHVRHGGIERMIVVCHGPEQMRTELEAIVDNGGRVHNVVVEHEIYGYLEGSLNLRSRRDVDQYIHRMEETHAELLSRISGGIHSHLIEADTEADMDAIEHALAKLGILYNS